MKSLKSFLAVVLMFSFLSSTLGVQIHKHYCKGYLAEVSFYFQSNPCADGSDEDSCAKVVAKSCCKDEFQLLQLDVDFQKTNTQRPSFKQLAFIPVNTPKVTFEIEAEHEAFITIVKTPSEKKQLPLFLLFNRYTLYG